MNQLGRQSPLGMSLLLNLTTPSKVKMKTAMKKRKMKVVKWTLRTAFHDPRVEKTPHTSKELVTSEL